MSRRNLDRMTWMEVRDLDKRAGALVLPLGSLEQHGPHLAIDCDLYFSERFLDLALERLPEGTKIWRLPIVPITKSNEHQGYAGSFWLSARTLLAMLDDIADGAVRSGFRRLVLWNCHGGNRAILDVAARDIHARTGLMVFTVFPPATVADPVPVTDTEAAYGIHAGDWETSVMLALSPERVRSERADVAYPPFAGKAISLEFGGANLAWITSDWMKSGTWGDATVATAERGQARLDAMLPKLVVLLSEISAFELPATT
jgi:creatinine amidohydrolase/Fe(II)-dependent formamide hydrolase-like protein